MILAFQMNLLFTPLYPYFLDFNQGSDTAMEIDHDAALEAAKEIVEVEVHRPSSSEQALAAVDDEEEGTHEDPMVQEDSVEPAEGTTVEEYLQQMAAEEGTQISQEPAETDGGTPVEEYLSQLEGSKDEAAVSDGPNVSGTNVENYLQELEDSKHEVYHN